MTDERTDHMPVGEPSYVKHRPSPRDSFARWQTYADYLERTVDDLQAEVKRLRAEIHESGDCVSNVPTRARPTTDNAR